MRGTIVDRVHLSGNHNRPLYSLNVLTGKEVREMTIQEVREIANRKGVETGKLKKTILIRAIQKVEGYSDCFATLYVSDCNQINCLWRGDCKKEFRKIAFK